MVPPLAGPAWKADGKGAWKMEIVPAEHREVGKGTEQKGKELGQTVANYGEERSTAAGQSGSGERLL